MARLCCCRPACIALCGLRRYTDGSAAGVFLDLLMISLLYMAIWDDRRHEVTFLPRLRPYAIREHRLL